MPSVLLTGGTGFVGRQIAQSLLERGFNLKLVVRPESLTRLGSLAEQAEIIQCTDLFSENVSWWSKALHGADTVIHSAWYVEPGKYLDSPKNIDCLAGSLMLAEASKQAGIRHFIGIGTCFEYRLPNLAIHAGAELGPVTLYAAAKLALLKMLEKRFSDSATKLSWARIFYLYGEGEHPARLFPTLHRTLAAGEVMKISSADKVRDFLDVRNAGSLIADVAQSGQTGIVNICSGEPVTLRQIAERVADIYGRRDLLEFGAAAAHPRDPQAVVGICNVKRPAP